MKTVYRYSLRDGSSIKMPSGSKILKIVNESIWAFVDTDKPTVLRNLLPVKTGEEIPDTVVFNPPSAGYVGSNTFARSPIHYFDGGETAIVTDEETKDEILCSPGANPRFVRSDVFTGGHLIGTVTCSYKTLVVAFGEPDEADGNKVSSEWSVKDTVTGDGFSLYDYEETVLYNSSGPTVEEFRALDSYDWHIGGLKNIDFDALKEFLAKIKA